MNNIYGQQYDVVVAGGGVSGVAAAVAAARAGAQTLVVEQSGSWGGTLTGCGVAPMMTFFAGEKQVIGGIMQEIVQRLTAAGDGCGHIPDTTQYVSYITPFAAEGLKRVLDELLTQAGCTLLLHTFVGGVQMEGRRIAGLTLANKDGMPTVRGKVYIDATGDGDLLAWAGVPFQKGRPEDGAAQPMTLCMKYCNVDTAALRGYIRAHLEQFPRLQHHLDLLESGAPLAVAGFAEAFRQAKAAGELSIPREDILMFETCRPGEFVVNTTRILGCDATSAAGLTAAELEGRRQCAQLDRFLRQRVPGFAQAVLEFTGPSVGVRGSRQMVGRATLTAEDLLCARRFPSVIAHTGYPIDIHSPDGEGTCTRHIGEQGRRPYCDIPYEILLPQGVENLLAAGRCVSASFEAQASVRVTPSAGAMGQAAGIAAALAAREGVAPAQVEVRRLQALLVENGAYLELPAQE